VSAEIKESIGSSDDVEVELIGGSSGIFDVKLEGKLLFSKFKQQRFPNPGEISAIIGSLGS
jgi:selT/selW/selH-like putative selenoprotein